MPDSGSLRLQVTVAGLLFQPSAFGAGEMFTAMTGGVVSCEYYTRPKIRLVSPSQWKSNEASRRMGFRPV